MGAGAEALRHQPLLDLHQEHQRREQELLRQEREQEQEQAHLRQVQEQEGPQQVQQVQEEPQLV